MRSVDRLGGLLIESPVDIATGREGAVELLSKAPSYPPIDFTNCVLYLPGMPGYGTTIKDYSSEGNDGTITGATWVRLPSGLYVLNLDGSDDKITIPYDASLTITSEDFTFMCWARFNAISEQNDVYNHGSANTDGWVFYVTAANHLRVDTWQAAAQQTSRSTGSITAASTWYFLAATRSGASVKVWQDAVDVTTTSGTHIDPTTNTRDVLIGNYSTEFANERLALPRLIIGTEYTVGQLLSIYNQEKRLFGV